MIERALSQAKFCLYIILINKKKRSYLVIKLGVRSQVYTKNSILLCEQKSEQSNFSFDSTKSEFHFAE